MSQMLLGARFPMLMNPMSIVDAPAPYAKPSFPETVAIQRPSGDHASECASATVAIARALPPPTGRAYSVVATHPHERLPVRRPLRIERTHRGIRQRRDHGPRRAA
jgi:hypothetical protein